MKEREDEDREKRVISAWEVMGEGGGERVNAGPRRAAPRTNASGEDVLGSPTRSIALPTRVVRYIGGKAAIREAMRTDRRLGLDLCRFVDDRIFLGCCCGSDVGGRHQGARVQPGLAACEGVGLLGTRGRRLAITPKR